MSLNPQPAEAKGANDSVEDSVVELAAHGADVEDERNSTLPYKQVHSRAPSEEAGERPVASSSESTPTTRMDIATFHNDTEEEDMDDLDDVNKEAKELSAKCWNIFLLETAHFIDWNGK